MSLFHKHPLFGLQEVPDVPCFGIPALSCLLLFLFLRVPPRFLFCWNECRTTLVFPSCQINNLSDYIERKDTVSNVLNFMFLPFAAFIRWLSTYPCCFEQGLLLSFGFNSPQLLLLVVVALDLFGVRLSPVARKLNQSLSVLAVILRVVLRDVAPYTLPFSVLSDSVGVRHSPFPVSPHHFFTVQDVVSAFSLTIMLFEFLVSVLLLSSHCIP